MPPKFSRELKNPVIFRAEAPWYQGRTSPCEVNCPAGNAIQRATYLIQHDRFDEALETLKATNPFPGICGRVCHHPCESYCNRDYYDEPMSIRALERAASDHGGKIRMPTGKEKTGRQVAIIGSGPAGLTCAYFLALFGHEVTIFEALPVLGGTPRVAIPDYRLPKDVVDRDVGQVLALGVRARTNTKVGRDVSFEELLQQYGACLIAAGTWQQGKLDIPGGELAISGRDFLIRANFERPEVGERVVVVGGSNAAIDAARTALRLGSKRVLVVYRRSRAEMPAYKEGVEAAEGEGIEISYLAAPTRISGKDGKVRGVECIRMELGEPDEDGRRSPVPIQGSEFVVDADMIIPAIGEAPDLEFLKQTSGLKFTRQGTLEVDPFTLATGRQGVFAAGDVVTGPGSVAEAIGSGRQAAVSINCYLQGVPLEEMRSIYVDSEGSIVVERYPAEGRKGTPQHVVDYEELRNLEYFEKKNRVQTQGIPFPESVKTFEEINRGYGREEAKEEASRCFHCGHCFACEMCVDVCPGDVLAMIDNQPQWAYPEECIHCGACLVDCPAGAIHYHIPLPLMLATSVAGDVPKFEKEAL